MSPTRRTTDGGVEPMYASVGHDIPKGSHWTFEPKYDGVRVVAHVSSRGIQLVTRNGNDKARQFPEITRALGELGVRAGHAFTIDGEIVGLVRGDVARFQTLQSRMHLKGSDDIVRAADRMPAALVAFDMLSDDRTDLTPEPWTKRREHLEILLGELPTTKRGRATDMVATHLRITPTRPDGKVMLARARRQGWEGIIAKRTDAVYSPGVRSDAWLKLKIDFEQEFVVGGFTEPRKSREDIGALLLGYFDPRGKLIYVGHMGGGFTRAGLKAMRERLQPLIRKTSPFETEPATNEAATWVRPKVVVEVKFSEWTADGRLRQPILLGVRDDKPAKEVTFEGVSIQRKKGL
ncbi:MAG: non-homologous end-joining DNA ligase [Gemmatimonadota bacterium]|nr:non-homologous end-joining DNA ligase [Gemmatimonadota bacterium]